MTDKDRHSHDAVIERARNYLNENGIGHDFSVHEVFYREAVERTQLEAALGRALVDDELRLMGLHNKSGWIVQFVFEECQPRATPQGPRVLLDDDGSVSHYRPM